jgi:hypothetical protein
MRSPRPRIGGPVCIFLGPSCIDRPMDLPFEVLFLAAQFIYFFEKMQRSVLFFYIRIGMPGTTYVSLLTILYIFKLFYMLLYIIFIVIIYLTDTYICKKTISHILLTYKNNFLTNKILDCFGTKILVIVYKSLVRFKDECNNITYYLNIFITKCSALFYFLITLLAQPNIIIRISPAKSRISRKCKWPVIF